MLNDQDSSMAANAICHAVESATNAIWSAAEKSQESIQQANHERMRPAVLWKPRVFRDGNQWCALLGNNLQEGICGFGDSPADATYAFDKEWNTPITCIGGKGSTSTENITRSGELEAHKMALLADVKDCQQQSRDYQAENAVIKSQMAELKAQIKAESDAHESWQNEHLKVDGEQCRQIRELEAQVAALSKALNGFIANSCRVDWPADIYDAAIAAQKGAA